MVTLKISDNIGSRIDKFLCQKYDISFALAQKIIRQRKIKVNNKKVNPDYKLNEGDEIAIFGELKIRNLKQKKVISENSETFKKFLSYIIYEDENLLVINKPSGLAVQGGSGIKISVDDYIKGKNWQLVHRLDKDTSGVLLIAKNNESADFLTNLFKNKQITKIYLAIVNGVVKKDFGVINIPLKKKMGNKNEKVYPDLIDGKEAITNYKLLKTYEDYSLVELNPITGRTHQIRVHLKEIGHPIIGDVKYGGRSVLRSEISKRLCLHAKKIIIDDYYGKRLEIVCDVDFG